MPSYSGVWNLVQQYQAKATGNWPLPPIPGDIGLFGGGGTNVIQYITITTTGNSTDFGDLTVSRSYTAACASATRGVFGGGSNQNVMDYVTINTLGNAADFGEFLLQVKAPQVVVLQPEEYLQEEVLVLVAT